MSEKRDDETVTQFTMRKIREEIIEECAKAVEGEYLQSDTGFPEDKAYDQAIGDAAESVRALSFTSGDRK